MPRRRIRASRSRRSSPSSRPRGSPRPSSRSACAGLDDSYHIGAVQFAGLVKIHTRDAVRALVFPSCQLGSGEREMIEEMVLTAVPQSPGSSRSSCCSTCHSSSRQRPRASGPRRARRPEGGVAGAARIKRFAWMESRFRNMITIRKRIGGAGRHEGMKSSGSWRTLSTCRCSGTLDPPECRSRRLRSIRRSRPGNRRRLRASGGRLRGHQATR
jgi:hypothetical protein